MEFLKENWIVIVSVVIALIGGVPGVISIVDYFKNKPILSYRLVNIITGAFFDEASGKEKTMLFLTGTISNQGSSVLTPAYFELKGSLDYQTLNFEKQLIPETIDFGSEKQSILVTDPSKNDLQKFNSTVSTGMPLYGHLLFYTYDIGLARLQDDIKNLKLTLICIDVFGKKHKVPIHLQLKIGDDKVYPKHGVEITTKP